VTASRVRQLTRCRSRRLRQDACGNIADEPDYEAILTVEQFRARQNGRFGVIVIEDHANASRSSITVQCHFGDEDSFTGKIIDNAGRNGRYWWAKNSRIAREQLNARPCQHQGDPFSKS
jgi:hypothetical protein